MQLPVEMISFTGQLNGADAQLTWTTAIEESNAGFSIEHRGPRARFWSPFGFVEGEGTASEPTSYTYTALDLEAGLHRFRLRQVDVTGTQSLSKTVSVQGLPEEPGEIVVHSSASAHPRATITPRETGELHIALYDILGRQVDMLHQGTAQAGETVNVDLGAQSLSSGTYFLRSRTDQGVTTKRMVVVR